MQKSMAKAAALVALMIGAALASGQQPAGNPPKTEKAPDQPAKSKLEEMIEKALKDNPDVRLAAAKLAEAEAELSRSRLLVVQKVASAYQAVEAQKAAVESATAEFAEVETAYKAGRTDQAATRTAQQKLMDSKAKLAQLEAELPYLLGQQAVGADDRALRFWLLRDAQEPSDGANAETLRRWYLDLYGRLPTKEELSVAAAAKATVQGPAADRIRAALDKPFTYDNKGQFIGSLIEAINQSLSEDGSGLMVKNTWLPSPSAEVGVNVKFDHMPIGAVLEFVEDTLPGYRAVVRDYGVVIVRKDDIPPGAPLLRDFWKGANAVDKTDGKEWAPNPPPVIVEGVVKEVAKDGLVRLSVGSDAGLAKGNTLEVFRQGVAPGGLPLYVTRLRIVDISAGESVCKAMIPGNGYVQPGDKATSQLMGRLPAKFAEGVVKDVDKDGLIHINLIGNSNGLAKDDVMTVIRQESENGRALLVGDVRVVEVKDGAAVAQSAGLTQPVRPGDKVRGPQK